MSKNNITKKIANHFYKGRYFEAKKLIIKYLENAPVIDNSKLAYIFGITFFYTNDYEEAIKYLDLASTFTTDSDILIKIALTYRLMRKYGKAKIVLEGLINSGEYHECLGYYLLAKTLFFAGDYKYALELFELCLSLPGHENHLASIQKYIVKSKNHLSNNTSKIDYKVFKDANKNIARGHIVYLRRVENPKPNDLGFYKRPYLIFDLNGDTVYAFGLSMEQVTSFKLLASTCSSPTDKYILSRVVTLNLKDVESVVGYVEPEHFNEIAYYLYNSHHHYYNEFIPLVPKDLNIVNLNNVIVVYNSETQKEEYFYVYEIEENCYKTVRLDVLNGLFIPSDNFLDISLSTPLYDVIPLKDNIVSYINCALDNIRLGGR